MFWPPLSSQLLKSLTPEENTQCRQGLFFQDGRRRVDYILTYHIKKSSRAGGSRLRDNAFTRTLRRGRPPPPPPPPPPPADAERGSPDHQEHHDQDKAQRRDEFESGLLEMGLELERDEEVRVFVQACCTGLLSVFG
ncbi:hypothetical protein PO909_021063 [Leuciscus waleckii]